MAIAVLEHVRRVIAVFQPLAGRLSNADFIRFDSAAVWVYVVCMAGFVVATAAALNGSSIGAYTLTYGYGGHPGWFLGTPRNIRSDEWVSETPAILNQTLRADRFELQHTWVGDDSVALLANLPVRHIAMLFRPQLWPFFVLPLNYAYAAYWQFKALILLTGLFTFLLLVTRSTLWSIAGALWYFFSPGAQWTYSWPSGLPEMVGLICWATVLACFLTIGTRTMALIVAGIGMITAAIDFALCAYLPHMIPLFWVAVFFFVSWCIAYRQRIFTRDALGRRALVISGCVLVIAVVGMTVYIDARNAINGIAHTVYPGKRLFEAHNRPLPFLMVHFLEWTQTEHHFPASMSNICEAAGFLWLAPATLFCTAELLLSRWQKSALIGLWCSFGLILFWLVAPFPSFLARAFGLNLTEGPRCLPALAVANIAIVAVCMSAPRLQRRFQGVEASKLGVILRCCGVFLVVFSLLQLTNRIFSSFFSSTELTIGVCFTSLAIILILEGRKLALAILLCVSHALVFGGVNPLERGLGPITDSALFKFVRSHPELRSGRWLAYSNSFVSSGFLASTGLDVYTGLVYLPDIDHFSLLASNGLDVHAFNRDGLRLALPLPAHSKSFVESPWLPEALWHVSPSDPILRELGIKYVAFDHKPATDISAQLIPITSSPVSTFWLYRIR